MYVQIGTLPERTHYHDGLLIIFSPAWRLLGQNYSRSPGSHTYEAQRVPSPPLPPKKPQTNGAEFTKAHPAVTARTNRGHHDSSLPAVYIQLRYNMDIANKKKTSRREKSHEALAPHHGCNTRGAGVPNAPHVCRSQSRCFAYVARGGCARDSAAAYVCFLLHPSVSEEKDKLSQLIQGSPLPRPSTSSSSSSRLLLLRL